MTTQPERSSNPVQTVTPCLWFDDDLEQAVEFWCSVVPDSRVTSIQRGPDGVAFTGAWVVGGVAMRGINGGPQHAGFSETVSLSLTCETQEEVDHYWATFADGGTEGMCSWVRDRFGLWWQVVPTRLGELLGDPDPARAHAAMQAMLGMRRIVVADLEAASDAAG